MIIFAISTKSERKPEQPGINRRKRFTTGDPSTQEHRRAGAGMRGDRIQPGGWRGLDCGDMDALTACQPFPEHRIQYAQVKSLPHLDGNCAYIA